MAVKINPLQDASYQDNNGMPLDGGKLFFYIGGSFSVQKTTYSDSAGTIPNSNPIVLDSSGRANVTIFLTENEPYNMAITMPDGTTILKTYSNVTV